LNKNPKTVSFEMLELKKEANPRFFKKENE